MRDLDKNTINGLNITRSDIISHPSFEKLKDTLYMENDVIKSTIYKDYIVQFLSFTFYNLDESLKSNKFVLFKDHNIKNFLNLIYNSYDKFLDFIEIGTSDFDTEIEKNDNKIGISIEAVKYYTENLPNKNGCVKRS